MLNELKYLFYPIAFCLMLLGLVVAIDMFINNNVSCRAPDIHL
jgi:hypothetical protein